MLRQNSAVSSLCNRYNLFYTNKQVGIYSYKKSSVKAASQKLDWNRTILEAKKIVGYSTSVLNHRWLYRNEIANVDLYLQKLDGSNHPFINTAKSLFYNGRNNMQIWELIILLISKAAGHLNATDMEKYKEDGISNSQRVLAEVTERIRIGHLIHTDVVNIQPKIYPEPSEMDDMTFGNKLALLSGDYLFESSFAALAALKIQDLLELMSSAIKDLTESEFVGRRDSQDNPLPSVPPTDRTDYAVKEWTLRNVLSAGALLGKSCKGTLKIAGHKEEIQEHGYNFGKHLILTWQACLDLTPFINKNRNTPFNLCSAPVMFHIEHDPSILVEIDKGLESVQNVNYGKVFDNVINGPGIELTKRLRIEHLERAMEVLNIFQESDARNALSNIIAIIGES